MRALVASAAALTSAAVAVTLLAGEPAPTPPRRSIDVSRVLDGGAPQPIDITLSRTQPDPPPLAERMQWVFDLRWDRGDVWLLDVGKLDRGSPQPTPRAMGRFALELFEGAALVERVRFDFPLLGPPEPNDAGFGATPSFGGHLRTRIAVVFPATAQGTRLELWDRATDRRWSVPWPPTEGPATAGSATATPTTPTTGVTHSLAPGGDAGPAH